MYLGTIADPGSDVDKFLVYGTDGLVGYRTGAEVLSDIGALPTSTTVLAFDGSTANGVCTYKDADEISVESTLIYDSETLNIGADDNGPAYIKRLTHSDEAGGMLQVLGGAGTGTNKAGGDLRLGGGLGTGSGVGGNVSIYTSAAGGSGSSAGTYGNTWSFHDTGELQTAGDIELGHASDTTIARASAGVVSIQGSNIVTSANLDAQLTDLHAAGVDGSNNQLLTDDGDGTVTSEALLTFYSSRLVVGSNSDQAPHIRLFNDENYADIGISNAADGHISGSADGDLVINGTGDHKVIIGQNNAAAITIDDGACTLNIKTREFVLPGTNDGDYAAGDVVYFGGTTSMTAGKCYYYTDGGAWALANAGADATATGLLAIALGAASDVNGMLLRGMVTPYEPAGSDDEGKKVYLRATDGACTTGIPTTSGNFVRIIGYMLHASNDAIYFCPDNSYVEVA
tara:strand:- start:30 stop:1397 length:1368 start_codon:yes stop_codon:yes gene_type:complete